jgi:hypothetical protein
MGGLINLTLSSPCKGEGEDGAFPFGNAPFVLALPFYLAHLNLTYNKYTSAN